LHAEKRYSRRGNRATVFVNELALNDPSVLVGYRRLRRRLDRSFIDIDGNILFQLEENLERPFVDLADGWQPVLDLERTERGGCRRAAFSKCQLWRFDCVAERDQHAMQTLDSEGVKSGGYASSCRWRLLRGGYQGSDRGIYCTRGLFVDVTGDR
jgi:hypothetical protein